MPPIKNFVVEMTNSPQAVYYPGAKLEGRVVLDLEEDMPVKDIYVICKGHSRVGWTEGGGQNVRYYWGSEQYMNQKEILLAKPASGETELKKGHYEYPFSYMLPDTLPCSYESSIGRVRYSLRSIIERPWNFNPETKRTFTVLTQLDLNKEQGSLKGGGENTDSKVMCCWCCKSDPISATMRVERLGFVPGESVKFSAEIHNQSSRTMSCTKAKLVQRVTYHASMKSKTWNHTLFTLKRGSIKGGGKDEWRGVKLIIPPVPPSYLKGCNIIDVRYLAMMVVDPSGIGFDLEVPVEIVVGTIPLAEVAQQYGIQGQSSDVPAVPSFTQNPFGATFAESAMGRVSTREDGDSKHTQGDKDYAPMYTYFTWEKEDPASLFTASSKK